MNRINTILFVSLTVLAFALPSGAEDAPMMERIIRGIDFSPMVPQIVQGTVRLDIPFSCRRIDTYHQKEKYPITFFRADCPGKTPCFSLSFTVMLIPDALRGYEEIVSKSKKEDFGSGKFDELPEDLIASSDSGAGKTSLIFGNHIISGNNVVGFYYNREKKLTSKIIVGLVYMESFSKEDWQYVLTKSFQVLKSVQFVK